VSGPPGPTVSEVVVQPPARAAPSSGVLVYRPQLSVLLKKVVNRTATAAQGIDVSDRVKGTANGQIDLTPYIGDGFGVTVTRTCRGGDTGGFTLTIPDQMIDGFKDTLYSLVEPMDVIEIRFARTVLGANGAAVEIPIAIRGFVSQVSRSEIMTAQGPRRTVTVSGHDYMKILQIMRIIYLPTMIVGQDLLTSFNLFLNYSIDAQNYVTAADFVNEVMNKAVATFIERINNSSTYASGAASPVLPIKVEATSPANTSNVSPFGTQAWPGGSIYDLLAHFGDVGAWQELFIEDRKDGPWLVYRPTPFKTAAGDYIQDVVADSVAIGAQDVLSIQTTRSDADVANYFWVEAPRYQLIGSPILQQDQSLLPLPAVTGYQNNDPNLYGIRLLEAATNEGGRYDGQPEADLTKGDADALNLNNDKRRILIENNKDNVVLESGAMRLKGNEKIKPGMYVKVQRGGFTAEYYAVTVGHEFTVGQGFLTTVTFERGTGFIERVKRESASSAYLAELTAGGVYNGAT
jgi:hypothetical protein